MAASLQIRSLWSIIRLLVLQQRMKSICARSIHHSEMYLEKCFNYATDRLRKIERKHDMVAENNTGTTWK